MQRCVEMGWQKAAEAIYPDSYEETGEAHLRHSKGCKTQAAQLGTRTLAQGLMESHSR